MRRVLVLSLLAISFFNSGCSRSHQLEKAARYELQGDSSRALTIYQKLFVQSDSRDPHQQSELLTHIAACLEKLQRLPEAFAAYDKAVQLDSHNTRARVRLGEIYLLAGDPEQAGHQATELLKDSNANPSDAWALYGSAAEAAGRDAVAREAYSRALERDPSRVQTAISLAELYNRSGDSDGARKVLLHSAAASPKSAQPWLALARLSEQMEDPVGAEQSYRKAVQVDDSAETNLRLAQFYERSAKIDEARALLRRVDQLRRDAPPSESDFDFSSERFGAASTGYLRALQSEDDKENDPAARRQRRALVGRLIESELAAASADEVTRKQHLSTAQKYLSNYAADLDEAQRYLLQAEVALANDDLLQAALASTQALVKAPESASAHYIAGLIHERSSDLPEARAEYQAAIDADDDYVPARIASAELSLQEHDYAGAQQTIVLAVRHEPSNIPALILFARSLIGTGSYDSARNISRRIEALSPKNPYAHIIRGEAALAQHQYPSALIEFQQAVLLDLHSREAIDGLSRVYSVAHITRPMLLSMEKIGMAEPRSATLLEITGRNFINIRQYQDAERCLRESLAADPSRRTAAEWLARLQANQGDLASASRSVAAVREFSPMLAGVEAEERNDLNSATARYEQAIRAGDNTGVAANNLAWLLAKQHRNLDHALELANRARELQPDNPAVLDTVGYVYLARREYTDAIKVLEHAQQLSSAKQFTDLAVAGEVRRHLAEAYICTGQPERAQLLASASKH